MAGEAAVRPLLRSMQPGASCSQRSSQQTSALLTRASLAGMRSAPLLPAAQIHSAPCKLVALSLLPSFPLRSIQIGCCDRQNKQTCNEVTCRPLQQDMEASCSWVAMLR